jgi:cysteine-rich repeat protein
VVIIKPTCGNGIIEHSETCDDGKTEPGDGCDSTCRKELNAPSVSEAEPNDDPRAANVLQMTQRMGGMTVLGQVASRCDHDMYSLPVAQGGTVRVTVSPTAMPCSAEGGMVKVTLIGSDGQTQVNAGVLITNDCPTLEAKDLPAGQYYVQIHRTIGEVAWPYQLLVETP